MKTVGTPRRWRALVAALLVALACVAGSSPTPRPSPVSAQVAATRVPILSYHAVDYSGSAYSVTPEQLDEQCRWLVTNGYTAVTLDQFWAAAQGAAPLPPNPVLLTNDDGWLSAPAFAEILARHGLVGNYFLNNTSPLPPDQIAALAQHSPVQAHTATHADLTGLDAAAQLAEITTNTAYLEPITGQPVHFLAWPFGVTNDSAIQAATASGIVAAFGLGGTAAHLGALDPYRIPRIIVGTTDTLETFATKVLWY